MSHLGERRGSHELFIYIAGVCHQDPKGKANLIAWLHDLSAANDEPPAFVGIEYNKDKFAEIKRQRPMLRQTLESICPRASSDFLDALSECLAYEPDAVADTFPNAEPLWLDTEILNPNPTANLYLTWIVYCKQYKRWVDSKGLLFPTASTEVLDLLSKAAWDLFDPQRAQFPDRGDALRSKNFACRVLDRINQGSLGWAIVVVGAYHASVSIPESMRSRLADARIECKVDWIKPNGPVPG